MNSLYQKMLDRGIDMSWYEKGKKLQGKAPDGAAPLSDDHCYMLSIYLLDLGGKLWTVDVQGEPYMMVRALATKPKQRMYLCAHCRKQFQTYYDATAHYKVNEVADTKKEENNG